MSLERAKEYLKKFSLEKEIMEFPVSSATVEEAAKAVNCEEKEIAKTLSFIVNDKPILIVVSGDSKIDNSKYKAEFHTKAKMIPFDDVEPLIGHAVGGVCPFGVKKDVRVFLDCSLKKLAYLYPACGSSNSAIKLTVERLEEISNFEKWIDVCKCIEQ
jgi:prolyl-tRNA editing enzyme YbaK/EbsC (Cys-tRNA(Pro) deacylase)